MTKLKPNYRTDLAAFARDVMGKDVPPHIAKHLDLFCDMAEGKKHILYSGSRRYGRNLSLSIFEEYKKKLEEFKKSDKSK